MMRSDRFAGLSHSRQTESLIDFSETSEATVVISPRLSLRIYSDARPHVGKIADLQKGLVLVHRGSELVGEGLGFGVPIVKYNGETYFSGSSGLWYSSDGRCSFIRKKFILDLLERNEFASVRLENKWALSILRFIADVYRRNGRLQYLAPKTLAYKMSFGAKFVKVNPIGYVVLDYAVDRGHVGVRADFGSLPVEKIEALFIFNEQAGTCFRRYADSDHLELFDSGIGAWSLVDAESAWVTDDRDKIGFRVHRVNGAILRRGREYLENSLDWVGLEYELRRMRRVFEYDVDVFEA